MGLDLTNFALEGGVSGRTSLKIEGKGNSEMTVVCLYYTQNATADARVTPDPQVKTNMQAFIALPACISSSLSLYLDPLPTALGFLERAVATGPIWPGPRRCSIQLGYMVGG